MPELEIYGDIGEDWWDPSRDITAKSVSSWLKEHAKGASEIVVRINSYGGWVSEGAAIHSILKQHGARIVTIVDGFALSAASVIAMAGDEIRMGAGALMMIHEASGGARGTASVLESTAAALRKMTDSIAGLYAERTGKPKEECAAMMTAETWLTAEEAKALGFCDVVLSAKSKSSARASNLRASNWLNTYKNLPASMLHLMEQSDRSERPAERRQQPRAERPSNKFTAALSPLGELARAGFSARLGDR